jgi:hypothetical protein
MACYKGENRVRGNRYDGKYVKSPLFLVCSPPRSCSKKLKCQSSGEQTRDGGGSGGAGGCGVRGAAAEADRGEQAEAGGAAAPPPLRRRQRGRRRCQTLVGVSRFLD